MMDIDDCCRFWYGMKIGGYARKGTTYVNHHLFIETIILMQVSVPCLIVHHHYIHKFSFSSVDICVSSAVLMILPKLTCTKYP